MFGNRSQISYTRKKERVARLRVGGIEADIICINDNIRNAQV